MYNTEHKDIDVVIPVYNGARFIVDALDSVVHQTLPPSRIIVIDDGSTDNTYELVSKYKETSPVEITLIKKENGGLSSARNAGIKESTSEFIAFLDADDTWVREKLEEQIYIYDNTKFNNLALVYCDYDVIDSSGKIKYKNYKAPLDQKRMRGSVFKKLLERNQIASSGSGVLIKKEVFDTVGLFDETLPWGEDWDMWLRITQKFEVDFTPKTLVHIRKNEHNMTANPIKVFTGEVIFYNKWIPLLDKRYPIPLFWADKITFRILLHLNTGTFLAILKNKLTPENYRKLFRKSFGSLYLHVPLFFIRQIFNMLFYPKYLQIATKFIKNRGV